MAARLETLQSRKQSRNILFFFFPENGGDQGQALVGFCLSGTPQTFSDLKMVPLMNDPGTSRDFEDYPGDGCLPKEKLMTQAEPVVLSVAACPIVFVGQVQPPLQFSFLSPQVPYEVRAAVKILEARKVLRDFD